MNTIAEDLEQFFNAAGTGSDDGSQLIELADCLPLGRAELIFLADAGGRIEMFHAASAADAGLAPSAATAVRDALAADDDCCCFSRLLGGQECRLFGVRLAEPPSEFLGGMTLATAPDVESLRRTVPLLRVCGRLALAADRAMRENRKFHTHIDHLEAEEDTLIAANADALAAAIEEQEKRLLEEQQRLVMEQACAATEAANRAKSQFLANMSHEIRTPLNAILGFTEILRNGSVDSEEERCDYLRTVHESANHLLELINDVLDLSKIESGRMIVETIRCSPLETIATVMSIMRARAQEKGLKLACQWPDGAPDTIATDPLRLKQLLMNLVGNSVKFTQCGEVRLVCRLTGTPERPQMALDVIDTGIGIAPDKLDSIFDAFVQADNSVTREFGGTGLGLAISRRIARAMGGDIAVRSEPGKGSTFTATLDIGSLDGVEIHPSPAGDAALGSRLDAEESQVAIPPACVLLVEDGQVNRKLISLVLRRAGADVLTAENGQIAVDLVRGQTFDVILMDMQMPVMDGYTAARELRAMGVTTPIVALTAHAMSGDEQKCLQAGCSAYLTKPVNAARLLRTIADALAGKNAPVCRAAATTSSQRASPDAPAAIVSSLPADDPEFRQIILDFVEYLERQREAMKEAWREGDLQKLAFLAHALKGTAGCAGFDVLTEPAKRIEQGAKDRRADDIPPALQVLDDLAGRIVVEQACS